MGLCAPLTISRRSATALLVTPIRWALTETVIERARDSQAAGDYCYKRDSRKAAAQRG